LSDIIFRRNSIKCLYEYLQGLMVVLKEEDMLEHLGENKMMSEENATR
jgi:hypothetical protein